MNSTTFMFSWIFIPYSSNFSATARSIGSFDLGSDAKYENSSIFLMSKSIGYIADVFSNLEDNDGLMHISNCDEGVKDVLELVGITTIIPTVDTEKEALEAMA